MTKKELRNHYKLLRKGFSAIQHELMSELIAEQVSQSALGQYNTYHIFLPIRKLHEINTFYLISLLQKHHKTIVVPVMHPSDKSMSSVLLTPDSVLRPNAWGVPEPEEKIVVSAEKIEVVLVPLLAYDRAGNRIGYGGGYYDRFLAQCPATTLKVGLSFFPPHPDSFAAISHPNDIVLDYVVTFDEISKLRN